MKLHNLKLHNLNEYSDYSHAVIRSRSSPVHCCLFFFPGCTSWKRRAVFLGRTTLEVALEHPPPPSPHPPPPHPSRTSSIPTYIAKDSQHTETLGKPMQVTGHILNAAFFFWFSSGCASWLRLPVQPTQPHPQCWRSACSLLCLSTNSAAEKCYRLFCDDVLTFDKHTLSVAFAAYLCNHLFMLL